MAKSLHLEAIDYVRDIPWQYPRTSLVVGTILLVLVTIRIISTIRFHSQISEMKKATRPIAPPEAPYVVPYLRNGIMFLNLQKSLEHLIRSNPNVPCFTLNIAGSKHHIVASPSITHQMSVSRTIMPKLDMTLFIERVMEYFWADGGAIRNMDRAIVAEIHKALYHMMHSSFINGTTPALSASLSTQTADLVTFSNSIVDQHPWERSARVTTTAPTTATANLFDLIRFFVSSLSSAIFFGPDFVSNYPYLSEDIFLSDTKFELFAAGIPQWLPSMAPAARARDRVVEAVRQHHLAYWKHHNGEDPGAIWSGISSTCKPIADRCVVLGEAGDFSTDFPEHKRGHIAARSNAAILWALQINAPSVAFWMIYYIYSDPKLLAQIREEISPFVSTEPSAFANNNKTGGITEKPRLAIDTNGLRTSAKLLQGTMHEVLRLETMGMTYKRIAETDITVSESEEDAAIYGRPNDPKTFLMREGDFVCIPHTVHHRDPRYFPDPERFDPRRFWVRPGEDGGGGGGADKETNTKDLGNERSSDAIVVDDDNYKNKNKTNNREPINEKRPPSVSPSPSKQTATEKSTAPAAAAGGDTNSNSHQDNSDVEISPLTTHPFGGGKQMCKGKKFAETEILLVVACILHLWEFSPVETMLFGAFLGGGEQAGEAWKNPGRVPTISTTRPKREVRVEVRRREI